MAVRAKFKVDKITRTDHWDESKKAQGQLTSVTMSPVYDNNPESENGKFFAATPNGQITLGTVNPAAGNQFEEGKKYYIDFTEAPE